MDSGNDLFVYKVPDVPTSRVYTIRPYQSTDEADVYSICNKTCKDGLEDTQPYPEKYKNLQADRIIGPYITLHPEFCFVVEDDFGIVGYACASPDYKKFRVKQEIAWIPEMCLKYPMPDESEELSKFAKVSEVWGLLNHGSDKKKIIFTLSLIKMFKRSSLKKELKTTSMGLELCQKFRTYYLMQNRIFIQDAVPSTYEKNGLYIIY